MRRVLVEKTNRIGQKEIIILFNRMLKRAKNYDNFGYRESTRGIEIHVIYFEVILSISKINEVISLTLTNNDIDNTLCTFYKNLTEEEFQYFNKIAYNFNEEIIKKDADAFWNRYEEIFE